MTSRDILKAFCLGAIGGFTVMAVGAVIVIALVNGKTPHAKRHPVVSSIKRAS